MKASLAVAALLTGGLAFHVLNRQSLVQPDVFRAAGHRGNLEECLSSARMVFDVHWAAACTAESEQGVPGADGHADCDLSDERAAAVNAWLDSAEARCMAESR